MTQRLTRPPRSRRARALIALAALALSVSLPTGSAIASPGSGEVTLSLKSGGEHSLLKQGVKVSYSAKTGKSGATKRVARPQGGKAGARQAVTLPVVDLELLEAATVRTGGRLSLSADGEQVSLSGVTLQIANGTTAISAKLGKRTLVVFRAKGTPQIDKLSVKLEKGPLSLTGKAARALREQLDLETLSAGQIGTADVDAKLDPAPSPPPAQQPSPKVTGPTPLVDPYAQQCALSVTSRVAGHAAGPAAEPSLSSPTGLNGGSIQWGFSQPFRFYVVTVSGGTITPIAPATAPNQPTGGFSFPAGGDYAFNGAGNDSDDKAVIDGGGEVVLCNSPHGFRIVLSNPTVTIDGANSRLTVDVDTNMSGVHTPTQRVDLATLNIQGADPFYNDNAKSVTWSNLPVTLTAAGSEALGLCSGSPGPCSYEAGDQLEPLSVTATTASEVAWPFNSSCDLSSTTWTGSSVTDAFPPVPAAPAALPTLTSPQAISSGSVSWGVRNSLRATINATGQFNLSGGATRSDAVSMSGEGKFFTWPATGGQYEAAGPGQPGRLVLQGTGSVGLCQVGTNQGYGTVLSNPTLILDGANSRMTMDVSSRYRLSWTSGRVDVVSLAIGNVVVERLTDTPAVGQETVKWTFPDLGADNAPGGAGGNADDKDSTSSSVKLAAGGASGLWLLGTGNPASPYKTVGTGLNKLAVSIVRPTS